MLEDGEEDDEFDRPESVVTMRGDRLLAVGILTRITLLAALSIWALGWGLPGQVAAINAYAQDYAIGPEDAPFVALTLGVIVACTYTVWPVFLVAHLWLVANRTLPWRLRLFAVELQRSRIIIRDGDTYKFRYAGLRTYLGETRYYQLRPNEPRHAPVTRHPGLGAASG